MGVRGFTNDVKPRMFHYLGMFRAAAFAVFDFIITFAAQF